MYVGARRELSKKFNLRSTLLFDVGVSNAKAFTARLCVITPQTSHAEKGVEFFRQQSNFFKLKFTLPIVSGL